MKKEIILLFLVNIGSAIGYSLIAPLFPLIALKRGLSESLIGLIIAAFAISNALTTPFGQNIFQKYGKKRMFFIGLFLEGVCTLLFGVMDQFHNSFLLLIISFIVRIVHGFASAITAILSKIKIKKLVYSLGATFVTEEEFMYTLGFLELGWSVGLSVGPLFASYLYYVGGYKAPFIFFAIFILILALLLKQINIQETEIEKEESFFSKLLHPDILFVFFCDVIDYSTKTFFYPTLSNHLLINYGLDVETSSLFFIINMASYFIFLRYINDVVERIGLKCTLVLGIIINIISVLFYPPLNIFPQSIFTIIFGLTLSGISSAAIIVPSLCELIRILKELKTDEQLVNEIASSIFNLGVYVGEAVGPFIGGYLTSSYDFKSSCVTISVLNVIFSVAYSSYNFQSMKSDIQNFLSKEPHKKVDPLVLDVLVSNTNSSGVRRQSIQINKLAFKKVSFMSCKQLQFKSLNQNLLTKDDF